MLSAGWSFRVKPDIHFNCDVQSFLLKLPKKFSWQFFKFFQFYKFLCEVIWDIKRKFFFLIAILYRVLWIYTFVTHHHRFFSDNKMLVKNVFCFVLILLKSGISYASKGTFSISSGSETSSYKKVSFLIVGIKWKKTMFMNKNNNVSSGSLAETTITFRRTSLQWYVKICFCCHFLVCFSFF